jgi:hypothetical protein
VRRMASSGRPLTEWPLPPDWLDEAIEAVVARMVAEGAHADGTFEYAQLPALFEAFLVETASRETTTSKSETTAGPGSSEQTKGAAIRQDRQLPNALERPSQQVPSRPRTPEQARADFEARLPSRALRRPGSAGPLSMANGAPETGSLQHIEGLLSKLDGTRPTSGGMVRHATSGSVTGGFLNTPHAQPRRLGMLVQRDSALQAGALVPSLLAAFAVIDRDGDGMVSRPQIRRILKMCVLICVGQPVIGLLPDPLCAFTLTVHNLLLCHRWDLALPAETLEELFKLNQDAGTPTLVAYAPFVRCLEGTRGNLGQKVIK